MMTFGPLLRAAAFGLLLLGAAAAWSAEEEPLSSPAAGHPAADVFAEAQALIARGAFSEALILLGPLAREGSADEQALFLIGLAAIGASQQAGVSDEGRETLLDAAIASFRTMLVNQPGLVRVRLELARAFFLKSEDDLARQHFEQVLAGDVPPPVAANVRAFLNQIRARKRWSFNLGFALAPDSNIGAGSEERTIYIFGLPFQRDAEELTTSGRGRSAL